MVINGLLKTSYLDIYYIHNIVNAVLDNLDLFSSVNKSKKASFFAA
jgi:predicted aldo/keto reductase-like oxidoreductase